MLTIKQKTNRRSLDANAYCWVLLDKLAVELSKNGPAKSPEEIYRETIPLVGGNSKIVPVREDAIDAWKEIWSAGRTGWICEDMGRVQTFRGITTSGAFMVPAYMTQSKWRG